MQEARGLTAGRARPLDRLTIIDLSRGHAPARRAQNHWQFPRAFNMRLAPGFVGGQKQKLAARSSRATTRGFSLPTGIERGRSTSAAIFARCRETSKSVTGRKCRRPLRKAWQLTFQPQPREVTIPAPVTNTRDGGICSDCRGNNTAVKNGQLLHQFKNKNPTEEKPGPSRGGCETKFFHLNYVACFHSQSGAGAHALQDASRGTDPAVRPKVLEMT